MRPQRGPYLLRTPARLLQVQRTTKEVFLVPYVANGLSGNLHYADIANLNVEKPRSFSVRSVITDYLHEESTLKGILVLYIVNSFSLDQEDNYLRANRNRFSFFRDKPDKAFSS